MGNTFTTPQPGIPVIMDGAESTSPTTTSTDDVFRSAESYASTMQKQMKTKSSAKPLKFPKKIKKKTLPKKKSYHGSHATNQFCSSST